MASVPSCSSLVHSERFFKKIWIRVLKRCFLRLTLWITVCGHAFAGEWIQIWKELEDTAKKIISTGKVITTSHTVIHLIYSLFIQYYECKNWLVLCCIWVRYAVQGVDHLCHQYLCVDEVAKVGSSHVSSNSLLPDISTQMFTAIKLKNPFTVQLSTTTAASQ